MGELLAEAGAVVICGGGTGVMAAVAAGARARGGTVIGIRPGPDHAGASPDLTATIVTNLGEARNAVIVWSADAVIAVGGSWGTLSEIALAMRRGTVPVVTLGGWRVVDATGTMLPGPVAAATPAEAVAAAMAAYPGSVSTPAADELLDIVDDADRVVGQAPRSEAYARRLRHRCVFVLVRDDRERVFVHRRAADKQLFPSGYDMFVGGVVGAGETYDAAAWREAREELGNDDLSAPVPRLRFLFETSEYASWCAVYELRHAGPVDPPASEVAWHGFLTEAELRRRLDEWAWAPDSLVAYHRLQAQQPTTDR